MEGRSDCSRIACPAVDGRETGYDATGEPDSMTKSLKIAPPNSLFFLSDVCGGQVPDFEPGKLVLATDSVVSIRCLANVDGKTKISLGARAEVASAAIVVFSGSLKTPSRRLVVSTVEEDAVLREDVSGTVTKIVISANRETEPDEIVVAWE